MQRILYVEDEPDIRLVAKMALEMVGGFEVVACACGEEALQAAPTARADLLLVDMMMPGMNGIRTLEALRAMPETAHTPAIFMTAKVQSNEIATYKACGAIDVIPKPFEAMELAAQIRAICARHRAA